MPVPTVDRTRLAELYAREERSFEGSHSRSLELFGRARRSLFAGVPMHWMTEWAGPFPVFVEEASEGAVQRRRRERVRRSLPG